ncbi:hypothetical protein Prubr_23970 [Polymorphospora rubra]|uniref:Uncharacterized protein n=1 Tax=Polymorphospora rubra TaxID=338584 RepID=A0A810MW16_9ACTN|nr:hypothetical protein Prubr_23970 [Polymorphospora rubra]
MPDRHDEPPPPPPFRHRRLDGTPGSHRWLRGTHRAEGLSGPTRRYVLIVASLGVMASLPIIAALGAGPTTVGGTAQPGGGPFLGHPSGGPVVVVPLPTPTLDPDRPPLVGFGDPVAPTSRHHAPGPHRSGKAKPRRTQSERVRPRPTVRPTPEKTSFFPNPTVPRPTTRPTTPRPTPSVTPTGCPSPTPTASADPTGTPSPTTEPTSGPSPTPEPTSGPSPTPEPTFTPEPTSTPTPEPTRTGRPTVRPTATASSGERDRRPAPSRTTGPRDTDARTPGPGPRAATRPVAGHRVPAPGRRADGPPPGRSGADP